MEGERRVTTLLTMSMLVRESVAALVLAIAAHALARGSALGTGAGKYRTAVDFALLELIPPV